MWLRSASIAITLAFATAGLADASPNLVINNSFETGDFTGWTQFGNTGFTGVDGNFAGVDPTDGSFQGFFGPVGSTGGIAQTIATIPSEVYLVTFDLQNFGGTPSSFAADFGPTLLSFTDSDGFDYTSFSFYVSAASASTALTFTFQQDPSFFLFDNISVTQTPEPSTLALIGLALISLVGAATMRRRQA